MQCRYHVSIKWVLYPGVGASKRLGRGLRQDKKIPTLLEWSTMILLLEVVGLLELHNEGEERRLGTRTNLFQCDSTEWEDFLGDTLESLSQFI